MRLELVDLETGDRLGHAGDFCVDTDTARLTGLVQYGRERLFGLLGREPDAELPMHCIRLIGTQTILVSPRMPELPPDADPLAPYREPAARRLCRDHFSKTGEAYHDTGAQTHRIDL